MLTAVVSTPPLLSLAPAAQARLELHDIACAVTHGDIAGAGIFTRTCAHLLKRKERLGIGRVLLTSSTDS